MPHHSQLTGSEGLLLLLLFEVGETSVKAFVVLLFRDSGGILLVQMASARISKASADQRAGRVRGGWAEGTWCRT